jgi:hypothetical protein
MRRQRSCSGTGRRVDWRTRTSSIPSIHRIRNGEKFITIIIRRDKLMLYENPGGSGDLAQMPIRERRSGGLRVSARASSS